MYRSRGLEVFEGLSVQGRRFRMQVKGPRAWGFE